MVQYSFPVEHFLDFFQMYQHCLCWTSIYSKQKLLTWDNYITNKNLFKKDLYKISALGCLIKIMNTIINWLKNIRRVLNGKTFQHEHNSIMTK